MTAGELAQRMTPREFMDRKILEQVRSEERDNAEEAERQKR